MTLIRLTLAAGLTLVPSAFASKPPEPVVDLAPNLYFSQPRTTGFYGMSGKVTGNNPTEFTYFQRRHIDSALRSALEAKGFEFVTETADADTILSWHLTLTEKTDVKTHNNLSYGASMGYIRYNRYAIYSCYASTSQTVVRVTEDIQGNCMIEPVENASVWRSITRSMSKGETIGDQTARDATEKRVLAGFPPGVAQKTP